MDLGSEVRLFSRSSSTLSEYVLPILTNHARQHYLSLARRPKLAGMYSSRQSLRQSWVRLISWVQPSGIFCKGLTLALRMNKSIK